MRSHSMTFPEVGIKTNNDGVEGNMQQRKISKNVVLNGNKTKKN